MDGSAGKLPEKLAQQVTTLKSGLEAQGYEVIQGQWNLFTIDDCRYAISTIGNCLGNNPAAPYVIPTVPLWQDEYADEDLRDLLGPTPGNTSWTYRLDEREALVVLGLMPPLASYFGMQTYVFTRPGTIDPDDEIYRSLTDPFMRDMLFMMSPDPSRVLTFSSTGDSINNVIVERQSGAAFNQPRYFIITADAVMEQAVTDALLRAGVRDRSHIFTERLSTDLVRPGLDAGADDFMTLIRYADPDNLAAGNRWRSQLPLAILRVRERDTERRTQSYPQPVRDERIARSELLLQDHLERLVSAVKRQWRQPRATQGRFESLLLSVDLIGEHCLARPMNCLGDTADADYQISPTATIDSGEVLVAVGTLGTATGNATYVSLSANWIQVLKGVLNIRDDDLRGSASVYSDSVSNTENFYVQYFARDCGELRNCEELTQEMVPRGGAVKIIQRNYLVPGSSRGPDPRLVLDPVLLVLDGTDQR